MSEQRSAPAATAGGPSRAPVAPPDADRRAAARAALEAWPAATGTLPAAQEELRRRYLAHLGEPGALDRSGLPDHLTASALVLDPTGSRTLLVLHRRGGFWVQPGGHLEPADSTPRDGALRELREETGLPADAVRLSEHPADLDHHHLPSAFGRCRSHLDVAHLAVVDPGTPVTASDESDGIAWWPLDGLPDGAGGSPAVAQDLPDRLARAAAALAQRR
ncbi:NUDIX hydrolase [uncultured Pseudokineococcus sp.]|uniref:NUDIX hydrolase n=1 Tax=uncultured Pseudokineococcus sp. TaxID=1642928 RepID=UPI0026198932|nr:NUDIX domain-containing protein [uncultured Pseudokineococcus sp.]